MRIAVIAAQGAIQEHIRITGDALQKLDIKGEVFPVTDGSQLTNADACIIPGGESTTISKLIHKSSVAVALKKMAKKGKPIMGTCAGSILLAKEGDEQIKKTQTKLLNLMDVKIVRNAFGRQRESFQTQLNIKHIGLFEAIFIRAPAIVQHAGTVESLASLNNYVVAAKEKNIIMFSFHPELTADTRIHEYFIQMGYQ